MINLLTIDFKGILTDNTSYNVGDIVIYAGRPVMIKQAFTSSENGFISSVNYEAIGGAPCELNAWDFGYRADSKQSSASANTQAINNAIAVASEFVSSGAIVKIPSGFGYIDGTIELQSRVLIEGFGKYSTVIQLADEANCEMVRTHVSTDGTTDPNASFTGVKNLCLDGRKVHQTEAHDVFVQTTNPLGSAASSDFTFDPTNIYKDLHIRNASKNGMTFNGRSDALVDGVKVSFAEGNSFDATFDTHFVNCISQSSGLEGFYIKNGAVQLSTCKAYGSGVIDNSRGVGFCIEDSVGGFTGSNLYAQNNQAQGFLIKNSDRAVLSGITSDSNNMSDNGFVGIELNNSGFNMIDGVCFQGMQGGVQIGHQSNSIKIDVNSTNNSIKISHSAISPATVGNSVAENSVIGENKIEVNGKLLNEITFAQV